MHANNHLGAMNAILSTPENLEGAISCEDHEYQSMYPEMIETAKAEKLNDAEMSFYLANEVENPHSELFNTLLSNQGKSTETFPYYVCPTAGIRWKRRRQPHAQYAALMGSCSRGSIELC